jgi:PAS domain S-box-containing protein
MPEGEGRDAGREAAPVAARDHDVLAAALDPIITIDAHGVIQSASDSVQRVFGWTPAELVGRNVNALMPEPHHSAHDGYQASYRRTGRMNITGRTREFESLRKNGEQFPIELSVSRVDKPNGGLPLFVGLIRDVSERNRLERELRLIKDLALTVGDAPDLQGALGEALELICTAAEWEYGEVWLPEGEELVGAASWMRPGSGLESFSGTMPTMQFRPGTGLAGRAWSTGRPVWIGDVSELSDADSPRVGASREAGIRAASAVPVLSEGETIAVLLFFVRSTRREDVHLIELVRAGVAPLGAIIQRKRDQAALQESEQRLRWALRAAHGSAWDWDLTSGEAWRSPEMYELWGVEPGTPMRSDNSLSLILEQDRDRVQAVVKEAMASRADYRCEFRMQHSERAERWMVSHGRVVFDHEGRAVRLVGITLDITERKRIEEELARHREHLETLVAQRTAELEESHEKLRLADRLASIGTLAAGLGHDMNNVLLPVRAHVNVLTRRYSTSGESEAVRPHIEEISKSVAYLQQLADGRFAAMIRHLLDASGARAGEEPAYADIWIADPADTDLREVKSWRLEHEGARLVLFGAPDRAFAREWESLEPVVIEQRDDFEALRAGLGRALAER